ncbi:hypothetical protein [Xylophilus ampelinus]|nr:hypothetical protein [Xylophilus ampelinus]
MNLPLDPGFSEVVQMIVQARQRAMQAVNTGLVICIGGSER